MNLADAIKQKAIELGFDLVGVTGAGPIEAEQVQVFGDWLSLGYAGQMAYMHRNFEKRINPAGLLEGAQSVICVGLNYKPASKKSVAAEPAGKVANFAQYQDYHLFIKKKLRKLTEFITSAVGDNPKLKICVDSAPVAERALAERAGIGFIGKNHMLINPELGLQIILGEIITNLKLQTDKPSKNNCSACDKCIAACPTGALRTDGQFDANKCISYLTIEHKDEVSDDLAEKIGDWLFGCDECVLACPWNDKAPVCQNKQFKFYTDRCELELCDILNLNSNEFETKFADSCIGRIGIERLKRNAQICLANIRGCRD